MMYKMLLSINPEHVKNIIGGTKKYEFRKSRCRKDVNSILIYCTSPVKKVVAEADIEEILEGFPDDIWNRTKDFSGISYQFYQDYFKNRNIAVAYKLMNIREFDIPRELSYYGVTHAPQSFMYISERN